MEQQSNNLEMKQLLTLMCRRKASDLYLTYGSPPVFKVDGRMMSMNIAPLNDNMLNNLVISALSKKQNQEFVENLEFNVAMQIEGAGRFRVNIFKQMNHSGLVIRRIEMEVPTIDKLMIPEVLKSIANEKRGLVILVGATGSGKSTSLAAMLDHRNSSSGGHIITVEDPVEFVHPHKKCIITQREVGIDTSSYHEALKNTLRQAPDVILVGEIRDTATMEHVIHFAETGHLVYSTLHANNSNQALERIMNFFPPELHKQIYMQLSMNLKGIISQRLIPTLDRKGRAAAMEIMINTPRVRDLISKGDVAAIRSCMEKGTKEGMLTFDQSLFELYKSNRISLDDAMANAESSNDLRIKIKMAGLDTRGAENISLLDDGF